MENHAMLKTRAVSVGENGRSKNYHGETYYGKPAIKSSHYGWLITFYFFLGGLASALQFISTVIDLLGGKKNEKLVIFGRYSALIGAMISPFLLITDLHTPRRWYNMLRIFRSTSPMSIGSWALATFGTFSGITAFGQTVDTLFGFKAARWLARLSSIPAALAGGVVSLYTGTLLATTSTPLWSTSFPYLSALFASSAASTAAAALTLASHATDTPESTRRRLGWFSIVTGSTELILALLIDRSWRKNKVGSPIEEQPMRTAWQFGVLGLGLTGPLMVHIGEAISTKGSRLSSIGSALAMLVGGFILRAVFVFGGKKSGRLPEDYFRLTQPEAWH
jgi:protein NrfD